MEKMPLYLILLLFTFNVKAQLKNHRDSLIESMKYAYTKTNLNSNDSLNLLLLDSLIKEKNKLEEAIVIKTLNMIAKIEETPTLTEIGIETLEVNPSKYIIIPNQIIKPYHNRYYVAVELSKKLLSIHSSQSNNAILDNIVSFNYEGCDLPLSLNKNYLDACSSCCYNAILGSSKADFLAEYLVNSNYFDDKIYYQSDSSNIYDERRFSQMDAYANLIMRSKYAKVMLRDIINLGSYPPINNNKRKNLKNILERVESISRKK